MGGVDGLVGYPREVECQHALVHYRIISVLITCVHWICTQTHIPNIILLSITHSKTRLCPILAYSTTVPVIPPKEGRGVLPPLSWPNFLWCGCWSALAPLMWLSFQSFPPLCFELWEKHCVLEAWCNLRAVEWICVNEHPELRILHVYKGHFHRPDWSKSIG